MTQDEFRGFVEYLRRNYPNCKRYQGRDTMNDWWRVLKNCDINRLQDSAIEFQRTSKYPPDIADLNPVPLAEPDTHTDHRWMRHYCVGSDYQFLWDDRVGRDRKGRHA